MRTQTVWITFFVVWLLAGCAGVDSRQSFDTKVDFTALNTYNWIPGVEKSFSRPRYGDYFMNVMDKTLKSKGYTLATENSDFLIRIPSSDRYTEVYSTAHGPVEFFEGKLIIQILDGGSKDLIWEGVARVHFSEDYTPEEVEKGIKEATEELLVGFPPEKQ